MSRDDQPPSTLPNNKSWISKIGTLLVGDIQNENELLSVLKDAQEKHLLDPEALSMMEGVLHVTKMRARDIMVPRVQMTTVTRESEIGSILSLVAESSHSRMPVIEEDRSKVVGILMAKDLLSHVIDNKHLKVENIMRPVCVVPESKRLNVLLKEFRTKRHHMAIVIDEYGMAAGLVTIEDILEQIVGEIEDEYDIQAESYIVKRNNKEFILNALTPIDEFNTYFSANLKDNEFDTIGGFIVHKLDHLPKKGEKLEIGRFRFEIIRADSRRLHLIKLKLKPKKRGK